MLILTYHVIHELTCSLLMIKFRLRVAVLVMVWVSFGDMVSARVMASVTPG